MIKQCSIKYEDVFNYDTLMTSANECCRGLMWKDSVIEFSKFKEYYISCILDQLYYKPGYPNGYIFDPLYHTTIFERGKERLISSLTVRDRVVSKCLNQNYILPLFRPKFIYDNAASLTDRGVNFAINRLKAHMQKASTAWGDNYYIAKIDIKSYFDSIPHVYIANLFDRYTEDKRLVNMICRILYQYQIDDAIHGGSKEPYGIGLGSEAAQSFGIICLNEFDHILKEYYRIPYMIRYMDDTVLIHHDGAYLETVISQIRNDYLPSIGLKLNDDKTTINKASEGVKFLKFHFYPGENPREVYITPNKKSIKKFKTKVSKMDQLYRDGEIMNYKDIEQSVSSFFGHINRGDSYAVTNKLEQFVDDLAPSEEEQEKIFMQHVMDGIEARKNEPGYYDYNPIT